MKRCLILAAAVVVAAAAGWYLRWIDTADETWITETRG